jgi:hypothetical protein
MAKQEFQVTIEMHVGVGEGVSSDEVEDSLEKLVMLLIENASGLALGPAGAIQGSTIELLFTVEAADAAEMYSKLHDIAVILRDTSGMDFEATSARRGDRELVLA